MNLGVASRFRYGGVPKPWGVLRTTYGLPILYQVTGFDLYGVVNVLLDRASCAAALRHILRWNI
ncbi:hypothetical protein OUZ56_029436 [Daphnia magna]|uniref:Uncharacterized protein n=1 Tax=Daphnia magna TaxID=35525 RepID=A0ABR0B6U2_9CRUS|nr:hypothetical protein OUZ56_029436 [Daphnia magna]